jgi:hypothetical protein
MAGRGHVLSVNGEYGKSSGIMGELFDMVARSGETGREGWSVEGNVASMAMASHVLVVSKGCQGMG